VVCCPEYPHKGTCSQPPGFRQPLTRVTVHGQRTALCHLDRTRVLLSRPSWLCGNGEHYEKVPGSDFTKLVALPPWLQKASFGGVCTSLEVGIPPHRTFASLGFVHRKLPVICSLLNFLVLTCDDQHCWHTGSIRLKVQAVNFSLSNMCGMVNTALEVTGSIPAAALLSATSVMVPT